MTTSCMKEEKKDANLFQMPVQSMLVPLPFHEIISLNINHNEPSKLASELFDISQLFSNQYHITMSADGKTISIEGSKDLSPVIEKITSLIINGEASLMLSTGSILDYAAIIYYTDTLKCKYTIIKPDKYNITAKISDITIKELLNSPYPMIKVAKIPQLSAAVILLFPHSSKCIKLPSFGRLFYVKKDKVSFLMNKEDMYIMGDKNVNEKEETQELEVTYKEKICSTKAYYQKSNTYKNVQNTKQNNINNISCISENITKVPESDNFLDDSIIDIANLLLDDKDQQNIIEKVDISYIQNPIIVQSVPQTSGSSTITKLIEALKSNSSIPKQCPIDKYVVYSQPTEEGIQHYMKVSKKYLKYEFSNNGLNGRIKIYHRFEWEDQMGYMGILDPKDRELLNLELERQYLLAKRNRVFETDLDIFKLQSVVNVKDMHIASIEQLEDKHRINLFTRTKNHTYDIIKCAPYVFAEKRHHNSIVSLVQKRYISKKNAIYEFTINKFIPIMTDTKYLKYLYDEYMIKVIDMKAEDCTIIISGIRNRAAYAAICNDYCVHQSYARPHEGKNTSQADTKISSFTNSSHKNTPTLKKFGLDAIIINSLDWKEGFKRNISGLNCLCIPLIRGGNNVSMMIGRVNIEVKLMVEVNDVTKIVNFDSNTDAYIDKEYILLKDESMAQLAIMYSL